MILPPKSGGVGPSLRCLDSRIELLLGDSERVAVIDVETTGPVQRGQRGGGRRRDHGSHRGHRRWIRVPDQSTARSRADVALR